MADQVIVALRIKADPALCFQLFTEEIDQWWRHNPEFAATPRSPGRMAFEPGPEGRLVEILASGKVFEIGRITAWEPGARLAFSWRFATFAPGMDGEVDVRFEPLDGETRVTVTHTGWSRVPQDHAARHGLPLGLFQRRYAAWWQGHLAALAQRLDCNLESQ